MMWHIRCFSRCHVVSATFPCNSAGVLNVATRLQPLPPAPRPSTPAEREHRAKIRARREAALDAKRQAPDMAHRRP
jgi:hypothetical protein